MTFTDMLMLLVVMFVLFLSFSEIESDSFKQNAGAISEAFNQAPSTSILPGISAITDLSTTNIDFETKGKNIGFKGLKIDPPLKDQPKEKKNTSIPPPVKKIENKKIKDAVVKGLKNNSLVDTIEKSMNDEIQSGKFSIISNKNIVTLRFPEKVTFASGDASLSQDIRPILDQLTQIVNEVAKIDKIMVVGHTDNVPISNFQYRSNWDLSAARAVSVVHHILNNKDISRDKVVAIGSADVKPLMPNSSAANRALNRRVEIQMEMSKESNQ